ncbi:cupredoxin domain-containing protein [Granulicella sibirica]|uniref:cupredoxin domain-containing protein n=1 Tax=Granulicella sibirica TaxID=2479048 RepID=UPI0010089F49|nr:cupredoxin domain-containing protein [Granulicella sibirica]
MKKSKASLVTSLALLVILCAHPLVHAQPGGKHIEVTASKFSFAPATITVKKGEPVTLVLSSTDVTHGLRIRELGVDVKVNKGKSTEATFTPDQTGDFVGHCSNFCGAGHGGMALTVHVVD